jgi:lantibiotic modifying enzyme
MVRYFENPYEDYTASASGFVIDKNEIVPQINEHLQNITTRLQPSSNNVDGGMYVGVTGVSYMFYYISKNPALSEYKREYLLRSMDYLKPALATSTGDKSSFLLGDAGTYALATVLMKLTGNERYKETLNMYKAQYSQILMPQYLNCSCDEFFVGRTGYLAGVLWMSRELQAQIFSNEELYRICDVIVACGRHYSSMAQSPSPLMFHYYNTEYLGAAHGISFILQMLLSIPGYLQYNISAAKDIKISIDFLVSLQTEDGNWPCCTEEVGLSEHELVHWCHGAPGIIYLMAKAFMVYQQEKYYNACVKAGEVVWQKGLLTKGPGICHGVAGNGYVFLLIYRLTGDVKYLYRAKKFADFMYTEEFLQDARLPDNPESLYEGTAGTVCYLADILMPDMAEFPFQDVFST